VSNTQQQNSPPNTQPNTQPNTAVRHPLAAVIERMVADHNRGWASGVLAEDSVVRDVAEGLEAVQFAPHYDDGRWTASSGREWVEGTAEAFAALAGQGVTWELHGLEVLPRGGDEAIAAYRIVHRWGTAERAPAQAFFLETWRRGADDRWRLVRHTAEKV
jgi:hypothetical protein